VWLALAFGLLVAGFGVLVAVVLVLVLGLPVAVGVPLTVGLPLVLGVPWLAVWAGLLDRAGVLVCVTAFDELGVAAGDDEHEATVVCEALPSAPALSAVALPSSPPGPALADGDALLGELRFTVTRN
jgi:hypothetical protein